MSTQYPVLYDRPINKWKVAELKEELKRRNLMIKGLKDDLVRRLDEAIRNERSNLEAQGHGDLHHIEEPLGLDEAISNERANLGAQGQSDLHHINVPLVECKPLSQNVQMALDAPKEDVNDAIVDNRMIGDDRDEGKADGGSVSIPSLVESWVIDNSDGTGDKMDKLLSSPIASSEDVFGNSGATKEKSMLRSEQAEDLGEAGNVDAFLKSRSFVNEVVDRQVAAGSENGKNINTVAENEEIEVVPTASREKASVNIGTELGNIQMDAKSHVTHSSNQVYEISSNLGFQVQCESITTDKVTLSNLEKTEIKENLNANNIQLEPEVIRQETVQSSSHKDSSGDDSFYALDDKLPDVKQGSVVEADDKCNINSSEKTYSADDVSVIDHTMENRTPDQVADDNELAQLSSAANRNLDDTLKPDVPLEHMYSSFDEKLDVAASVEQRELQDDKSSDANFSELVDVTDREPLEKINLDQSSADDSMEDDILDTKHIESVGNETKSIEEITVNAASVNEASQADIPANISEFSGANNDILASSSEKRKFEVELAPDNKESRKRQRRWNEESVKLPERQGLDVSLSKVAITSPNVDGLKQSGGDFTNERVVPPSSKAPTNSLRVDNFLRPFTLKAVQELLSKTGTYRAFWMDHIKTHCYVTYTSVEEAMETRNAIYNLQWPENGGRLLIAEFVDPEEVKLRVEASSQGAAPVNSGSVLPSQPPANQLAPVHQQDTRQATSDPPTRRERLARARSPVDEGIDPPLVTLDDLFRKTKATPRIYYLPLTDEQVALKLSRQRK